MQFKRTSTALVAILISIHFAAAQDRAARPTDAARGSVRSQRFNWAKVRLDEIDATLTAWEAAVAKLQGDAKTKAETALANMRAKRDAFRETIRKDTEQIETDWNREKAVRDADWKSFEASAQKFIDDATTEVQLQKTAFRARADAQQRAWQDAIDKLQQNAAKLTAENKAKADAALKEMKADAAAAQAKLEKLKGAGTESWAAYQQALADSRASFDRANQAAHDALSK